MNLSDTKDTASALIGQLSQALKLRFQHGKSAAIFDLTYGISILFLTLHYIFKKGN